MTTPQQPPPQQPPQNVGTDAMTVAVIAGALVTAASAAAALSLIYARIKLSSVDRQAMLAALDVVMGMPPEQTGVTGSATMIASRTNTLRRAQFALNSARRLTSDIIEARSRGVSLRQALTAGIARERRYFGQHLDAMWQRSAAAQQVDMASWTYGDLLGWYAVRDKNTSAECLRADGKNFYAADPPPIGYPGSVHPHCRCYPGPPHPSGALLSGVAGRRTPERVLVRA